MTWWRGRAGEYGVLFNRDEKKSRSIASPPEMQEIQGVTCIAPRDPDGGGTWILCNSFGVTIAVLNAYQAELAIPLNTTLRSRGLLPHLLAASNNVSEAVDHMQREDLSSYRPFTLVIVDSASETTVTTDASSKVLISPAPIQQPLVSSSFQPDAVFAARRAAFMRMVTETAVDHTSLLKFHRFAGEGATAYTPMMLRPDAQTFSLTQFRIDPQKVHCSYEAYGRDFVGASPVLRTAISRS